MEEHIFLPKWGRLTLIRLILAETLSTEFYVFWCFGQHNTLSQIGAEIAVMRLTHSFEMPIMLTNSLNFILLSPNIISQNFAMDSGVAACQTSTCSHYETTFHQNTKYICTRKYVTEALKKAWDQVNNPYQNVLLCL